ncbi:MAG: CBS domain-containing protein [Caldilineaceae bacterium]|nr:CBS domain-containing protein [Caldilineaceae bacterium]
MNKNPITVDESNTLSTAFHLMTMNKVRHLPVLNQEDELVGILTWGDIREGKPKRLARQNLQQLWSAHSLTALQDVREFMTENPFVIEPSAPIRRAVELMLNNKIGGLPVVDDERLVGMLTDSDVFRFLLANLPPDATNGFVH